jgi:hypothetical protein
MVQSTLYTKNVPRCRPTPISKMTELFELVKIRLSQVQIRLWLLRVAAVLINAGYCKVNHTTNRRFACVDQLIL